MKSVVSFAEQNKLFNDLKEMHYAAFLKKVILNNEEAKYVFGYFDLGTVEYIKIGRACLMNDKETVFRICKNAAMNAIGAAAEQHAEDEFDDELMNLEREILERQTQRHL